VSINLGQALLTAVVTAVVSLLVMESYQTTAWLAGKLMRWSVRLRYTDNPERATVREEELLGLLEDLPTLFKLPTAGGFLLRALAYRLVNHRSHARLAVKRDVLLLPAFYLFNFFVFSAFAKLGDMATRPWLLLPWLYGLIVLIPLVWRDRAPATVFIIQWVLTVAAWPIEPYFTPIVGIPIALHAVSFHCSRKFSLLALLASIIPMGLNAAIAFRVLLTHTAQLQSFIGNAIVLSFVTVGAWGAGRVAWASRQHVQNQTKSRAGQRSFGTRFRIAVVKAGSVVVCTGTVFGLELVLFVPGFSPSAGVFLTLGLGCGVLAAIESVARLSRFYHGLIGGITVTLSIFALAAWSPPPEGRMTAFAVPLSAGMAFGVATALTCVLIRKSKYVGVSIGILINVLGMALMTFANSLSPVWLAPIAGWSGVGFAGGVLAGLVAAVERRMRMIGSDPTSVVLPTSSLLGPGVISPEPSILVSEPHGEGELS
jgi:hypothetical protein